MRTPAIIKLFISALLSVVAVNHAYAKTLLLEGDLRSSINMKQQINFSVPKRVESLSFKFALPVDFSNKATSQSVEGLNIKITPEPASFTDETDKFGNKFKRAKWQGLERDIIIQITYKASIKARLERMESTATFPVASMPEAEAVFLKPSQMVQSEHEEIKVLANKLTSGATTQAGAVEAVLNWVADSVKYTYNPPEYDALYTLRTGKGNCQNFAHLSMALLRSVGIPSRIVGGISLKRQWKVPVEGGYLVQDMGQGGHAWMEIYYPDLGWLSYDPQQTRQFTSTRHIKQTHGLDSKDINDSWSGAPYLPAYSEGIDAGFEDDIVDIKLSSEKSAPGAYIASNNLITNAVVVAAVPLPVSVPTVSVPTVSVPPVAAGPAEFGNMEFPALVEVYQASGGEATRVLDKETAEYATSKYVYAQAFTVNGTLSLDSVSLAIRKFGGDGSLFVDVVKDDKGRPSLDGVRSHPIYLSGMKFRPGYYWADFHFPKDTILGPGRHWIVLRRSGEAIVNWFYIPGNPYGAGDDTRSTARGYKWEDMLNYDFVFKVKGGYN